MKYIIKGLSCPDCTEKIQNRLRRVPDLSGVSINPATNAVHLDPAKEKEAKEVIQEVHPRVRLVPAQSGKEWVGEHGGLWRRLARIIGAGLFFSAGLVLGGSIPAVLGVRGEYLFFVPAYLLAGAPVLWAALRNIGRGQLFDENFLMTVASLGAFALGQLPEAVAVMLFFAVGEYFQERAVNRSRRSISELVDVRPDYANLVQGGMTSQVDPESVWPGQIIEIRPGERMPMDGKVISGSSFLDTSALTGESLPRRVEPGGDILSGSINDSGLLRVQVEKRYADSSASRILDLVENAAARKAPTEQFITRFAKWYTPAVVFGALAVATIPPLIVPGAEFSDWAYRALVLLVISCPCALVVSIPLGYFAGIGSASRSGILVKGANFLQALTRLRIVALDKTGTLTRGVFKVTEVSAANDFSRQEVIGWAALAEINSDHPIAGSIRLACNREMDKDGLEEFQELKGRGVRAVWRGKTILAGNDRLLGEENIACRDCPVKGTLIHVAVNGVYAGYLVLSDELKPDSAAAVQGLKGRGVRDTVMLTGDEQVAADSMAAQAGVDRVYARLMPEDKVQKVEELESGLAAGEKLAFVGDGINDAPVLARAHIGVAVGGLGSDAAVEAADVVLMDGSLSKLPLALDIAGRTKRIVYQNIVLALGVKAVFVLSGAFGLAGIWEAVFADVGVALMAVLNSIRALKDPMSAQSRPQSGGTLGF
ncbi:MAG: heavy metal translocating P-type ATPase [Desulfonatronovibrionaceae bacterium]